MSRRSRERRQKNRREAVRIERRARAEMTQYPHGLTPDQRKLMVAGHRLFVDMHGREPEPGDVFLQGEIIDGELEPTVLYTRETIRLIRILQAEDGGATV